MVCLLKLILATTLWKKNISLIQITCIHKYFEFQSCRSLFYLIILQILEVLKTAEQDSVEYFPKALDVSQHLFG